MANGHGGRRAGSGRKPVAERKKSDRIILRALVKRYEAGDEQEAIEHLIKELMLTERGLLFVAQHILGKPTEKLEIKEMPKITVEYVGK